MSDFPESDFEPEEGDFFCISNELGTNDTSWTNDVWVCIGETDTHIRGLKVTGYSTKHVFPKNKYHFYDGNGLI